MRYSDDQLFVLLQQVGMVIARARTAELSPLGITRVQAAVLCIVKDLRVPATPAEIARCLFREPHTVSALVDRMEKQGLVRKVKDLERKNLVRVVLTEKGEEAYQLSKKSKIVSEILSYLPRKERDILGTHLEELRNKALEEIGLKYQLRFPISSPAY